MNVKMYYELKDMLCEELEKLTKKREITTQSLEMIDKLTHSIKSITTIIAMEEEYGKSGYYPYPYLMGAKSYEGEHGMSNARRRDSMDRYSREYRDDYSRDDARNDMIHDLRALMNDARDDKTRAKFQRFIDEIQNG
jgi:hypothetical protein